MSDERGVMSADGKEPDGESRTRNSESGIGKPEGAAAGPEHPQISQIRRIGKWVRGLPSRVVDRVMIWFIRRSGIAAKFAEIEAHQALLAAGMVRLTERLQRVERRLGMEKGGKIIVPR